MPSMRSSRSTRRRSSESAITGTRTARQPPQRGRWGRRPLRQARPARTVLSRVTMAAHIRPPTRDRLRSSDTVPSPFGHQRGRGASVFSPSRSTPSCSTRRCGTWPSGSTGCAATGRPRPGRGAATSSSAGPSECSLGHSRWLATVGGHQDPGKSDAYWPMAREPG
jgi:hypothetical protein